MNQLFQVLPMNIWTVQIPLVYNHWTFCSNFLSLLENKGRILGDTTEELLKEDPTTHLIVYLLDGKKDGYSNAGHPCDSNNRNKFSLVNGVLHTWHGFMLFKNVFVSIKVMIL